MDFDIIRGPFPGWNMIPVWLGIVVSTGVHLATLKEPRTVPKVAQVALLYVLGIGGFNGIVTGVIHIAFADAVAESIGWLAGNPFQMEVAFANTAIGTIGFLCFWRHEFWLAAIIARTIFSWGAGITHVIDIIQTGNLAFGNAGPILYADFLVPALVIALWVLSRRATPLVMGGGRPAAGAAEGASV